jgi:hypothetical protein
MKSETLRALPAGIAAIALAASAYAVGEDCTNPITLVVGTPLIAETNCGLGDNYADTCLGSYDSGEDAHYMVNITVGQYYDITLDPKVTAWSGVLITDECPIGAGCIDFSTSSSAAIHGMECVWLDPGDYYIMVDTYASPDCIPEYDLSISVSPDQLACEPNPCVPDYFMTAPGDLLGATNCGLTNRYEDTCLGSYDGGEDAIIEVTVAVDSFFDIMFDPKGTTWTGIAIDDTCPPDATCIETSTSSSGLARTISNVFLAAGTYYIIVDTYPTPDCVPDFDIVITEYVVPTGRCCYDDPMNPLCVDNITEADCIATYSGVWDEGLNCIDNPCPTPEGNTCEAPIVVGPLGIVDLPYVDAGQTTCGRVDDYDDPSTAHCMYYYDSGEDIIYELTVSETMNVVITLDSKTTTYSAVAIGTACPPTDACIDAVYSSAAGVKSIPLVTLEAGITYYIMVDTWSSPDCIPDFDLTIDAYTTPLGRCCYDDVLSPICVDNISEEDCTTLYAGAWVEGLNCIDDPCPVPNPGDICELPIVVGPLALLDLPHTVATQTTCGAGNDYEDPDDAGCMGYYTSGEDTVYEFTVSEAMTVDITLDPKTTTYGGIAIGTACPPIDGSCIGAATNSAAAPMTIDAVSLVPGTTYYMMVDTFASPDCIPEYDIIITEWVECIIDCPAGASVESEACGDDTNGGCLLDPPAFEPIQCGKTVCGTAWYDGSTRDTDWYEVTVLEPTVFTWTAEAEFMFVLGMIERDPVWAADCAASTGYIAPFATGLPCDVPVSVVSECVPAGTYWFFIAPDFDGPNVVCGVENDYIVTLTCAPCTLPTGACCYEDGQCGDGVTEYACVIAGGAYQGDDVLCIDVTCPFGACCFPDGSCVETSPDGCAALLGVYQGDGTDCLTATCPIGYCDSGASNTADSYCGAVTVGDIDNNTDDEVCVGYSDFTVTGPFTDLGAGQTYDIDILAASCGGDYAKFVNVYIDFNGDFDYYDAGEMVMEDVPLGTADEVVSGSFIVPVDATLGDTGMRVIVAEGAHRGPCEAYTYGETEDYLVTIVGGADCPWDFDLSGSVGIGDLNALLSNWGAPCPGAGCPFDYDESGSVGLGDLNAMLSNWGPCP